MFIKLFSIMGGIWIMEFVSWILNNSNGIWHIFDVINSLRGLWLMIYCVFLNKRIKMGLRSKLFRVQDIMPAAHHSRLDLNSSLADIIKNNSQSENAYQQNQMDEK
jgi:hypothetical protein